MSADGRVIDHVIWSDDDMTMRELVELFTRDSKIAQQGGVLCMVTDGYLGCDVMFQVSGEEIFWVFDIHRQKRLVVMDSKKKFLSIPVTYPLKMNVVDTAGRIQKYNGKMAVTVSEICEGLRFGDTLSTVMFEDDRQVSFNVGVNQGDSARLGRLDIVDTYEEKYLLANRILDCDLVVGSLAVPVYMPITVTIAKKFTYSSDIEAFQSWIEEIGQMSASSPRQEVVTCQEIIMIDEKPEGGHYEYIKPSNALRVSEKASVSGRSRTGAASTTSDGDSEDSRRSGRYSGYVERRSLPPLPRQPRPLVRAQSDRTPALPPRPDHLLDRRSPSEGGSDFPAVPPPRVPARTNRCSLDSSRLSLMLPTRRRPPPAVPVGDACGAEAADWSIPPVPSRSTARVEAAEPEPEPCRSEAATFPRRKQPASDSPRTVVTYQLTTLGDDKEWKATSPHGGEKKKKRNGMHGKDNTGSRGDTDWAVGSTSDHLIHKQYATLAVGNLDKDITVYGEHPYVVIRRQPMDDQTSGSYPVEYIDMSPEEEEPGENEIINLEEVREENEEEVEEVEERWMDQEWKQIDADELPAGKAEIFDMHNRDDVFESSGIVKLVGRVDLTS